MVNPVHHTLKQETIQLGAVPLPNTILFWVLKSMVYGYEAQGADVPVLWVLMPLLASHLIVGLAHLGETLASPPHPSMYITPVPAG